MSKSLKFPPKKVLVLVAGLIVVALILFLFPLKHWWYDRAMDAVRRGDAQNNVYRALVWYKVAAVLEPYDPTVLDKLAAADIKTGNDKDALNAAKRAVEPEDSITALVLESQALMELNKVSEGCSVAETAVQRSTNDEAAQLQLGLCYAVAGDNGKLGQMISLLSPSETAKTLSEVQHNNFSLAQELYVTGLLNASQRILIAHQVESSDYYLLRARITLQLGHDNRGSLGESRGLLEKGIVISPERTDLRQLAQQIDIKLGDTSAANEQGSRIRALQDGKV